MRKEELETPVLILDLDKLEKNIREMADFARQNGVKLRPHVKTHKTPAIAHKQIQEGAKGITVAKLGEAEVMAAAGIKDILIAYEIVGRKKIERLLNLANYTKITVGIDSMKGALPLSESFDSSGKVVDVLIEIDTGLGRCGVLPGQSALDLAKGISRLPGLRLKGIFTHEGHVMDANSIDEIKYIVARAHKSMVDTANLLQEADIELEEISVGSTPSTKVDRVSPGVTEIRPGTYVFYDASLVTMGIVDAKMCAATVLASVISRPGRGRALIDAGSKALTQEKGEKGMVGRFPQCGIIKGTEGAVLEKLNEEHGFLRLDESDSKMELGDQIEIIPFHICSVVNLFDEIVGVRGDNVEVVWPILARGKLM